MKDYLNIINEKFPIRNDISEKKAFQEYVLEEFEGSKYFVSVKKFERVHNNIIIGNIENAKVVFTAHYDTPATSIYPNLIMPRRPILTMIYQLAFPIVMALISLVIAFCLSALIGTSEIVSIIFYLDIYFLMFILLTRGFKNRHNKNDNTSGVACILSLALANERDDIAFVLFDNEEKGLLGSKAFNKVNKEIMSNKLVINLDCVGLGKNVLFISKKDAINHSLYNVLKENILSNETYKVKFFPMKGSTGNSDYRSFKCGVGVMVCEGNDKIGFYTSKIHTKNDTSADISNIEFIVNELNRFIRKI